AVSSVSSHGVLTVRPTAVVSIINNLPSQQHIRTNEYIASDSQVFVELTSQQRECLMRRTADFPMNTALPSFHGADHCYSRAAATYPVQSNMSCSSSPSNIAYSAVQAIPERQQYYRNQPITQRFSLPIPQSRYCNDFQPQIVYGTPQDTVRQGLQYGRGTIRTRNYRNDDVQIYNNYATGMTSSLMPTSSISQQNMVTMQHSELVQNQMTVSNIAESYEQFNGPRVQGVKPDAVNEIEVDDDTLARKQRRSKRRLMGYVDDGADADSVQGQKKKTAKRKKHKLDGEGTENRLSDANTDEPQPPLTHGELLKQKKRNMAFPKGTFLVRYADLDSDEYAGHIWLVDNHQLLQKYTYDGIDATNVKVFSRTERYSGWLCNRPWLYHPLHDVKGILGNMEKVSIRNHPTRDELFARREEESKKAPKIEPEQVETVGEAGVSDVEHSSEDHEHDASTREEIEDELSSFRVDENNIE
ncbi:hypothetical protein DICVIV_12962, partial [Dictyocaulus viviparus]